MAVLAAVGDEGVEYLVQLGNNVGEVTELMGLGIGYS